MFRGRWLFIWLPPPIIPLTLSTDVNVWRQRKRHSRTRHHLRGANLAAEFAHAGRVNRNDLRRLLHDRHRPRSVHLNAEILSSLSGKLDVVLEGGALVSV